MNQTTRTLLQELAVTGQAVIINHRARELTAARELLNAGICYVSASKDGYFIIKFGAQPTTF